MGRPHRFVRVLLRSGGYLLAVVLLPLLAGGWAISTALQPPAPPSPLDGPAPPPPAHDPDRLTAVIVAGTTGAESLDVLVPYQVLAESDRFNVYTVAPERRPLPLFPAAPNLQGVDFLPHLSLDDYDQRLGADPDVIVVPFIPSAEAAENAALMTWLRERATGDATLLTICGGSLVAAEAGLLDGRAATTHQNVLPLVQREHASVDWVDAQRWVEDGNVVSSAGITAAFDATLRVLERHVGRAVADEVAERLGYPHGRFLDDPGFAVPTVSTTARTLSLAYRWERTRTGVALYSGVDEVEVASIVDLYPRTHTTLLHAVASGSQADGGVVTTRHGLHLVPAERLTEGSALDRLLVPGAPPMGASAEIGSWAATQGTAVDYVHRDAAERFPIDAVLHDLVRSEDRASAALVARGIEYPFDGADLAGRGWPYDLLLRPLGLGLVGLLTALGVDRWRRNRRGAGS